MLLVPQSGVWPLLLHSWPLGPGEGHCSGQPSQPCWTRAIFWDMEKAAWKREDRQNMQSTCGGDISLPPGGPVIEGQQWPIPQGVTAVAAGDMPRRGPGAGGEGTCDRWPASDWKHLTPQERGALTFGGFWSHKSQARLLEKDRIHSILQDIKLHLI